MRMSTSFATSVALALDLLTGVDALAIPLRRSSTLSSREAATGNNTLTMVNFGAGLGYLIPITINGQSFDVQLDTGSCDLWVQSSSPVSGTFDSTQSTNVTFVTEKVSGEDKFGTLTLGGATIEDQVFLEVPPAGAVGTRGVPGILGLGPNGCSEIFRAAGNDTRASNPMVHLFAQNEQTEPFFTMQLGRPTEILSATPGTFTFGEVLPQFSNITAQPKIPVANVPTLPFFFDWTVRLDGMSVNGQKATLPASVADPAHPDNFIVTLDSGAAGSLVPQEMFNTIYGDLKGNNMTIGGQSVTVFPCDSEVNLTFTLAGQEYPVHPLDVFLPNAVLPVGTCLPGFFAAPGNFEGDGILGDTFLRSVYMLDHFGDTIKGGPTLPFIQLLSTIDVAQAHNEFVQVRVNGVGRGVVATDGPPVVTAAAASPTAAGAATGAETSAAATASPGAATATDSPTGQAVTAPSGTAAATDGSAPTSVTDGGAAAATDSPTGGAAAATDGTPAGVATGADVGASATASTAATDAPTGQAGAAAATNGSAATGTDPAASATAAAATTDSAEGGAAPAPTGAAAASADGAAPTSARVADPSAGGAAPTDASDTVTVTVAALTVTVTDASLTAGATDGAAGASPTDGAAGASPTGAFDFPAGTDAAVGATDGTAGALPTGGAADVPPTTATDTPAATSTADVGAGAARRACQTKCAPLSGLV